MQLTKLTLILILSVFCLSGSLSAKNESDKAQVSRNYREFKNDRKKARLQKKKNKFPQKNFF